MDSFLKEYLIILGFGGDICEVPKIKTVMKMWRKACMKHHPDKGGEKEEFQKIQDAFQKSGVMINELSNDNVNDAEECFAMKLFEQFNSKKENSNSYTIHVQNNRAPDWDKSFTFLYGQSQIPNQNESNGRHWSHNEYTVDGVSTKISITMWVKPKDNQPKLVIQSSKHLMTMMWVTN